MRVVTRNGVTCVGCVCYVLCVLNRHPRTHAYTHAGNHVHARACVCVCVCVCGWVGVGVGGCGCGCVGVWVCGRGRACARV